jgi:hypothetical protein
VAEVIQARAGNDGVLLCEFDGRVLELWSNPSQRFLAEQLVLQKRKDEKGGGVTLYVVPDRAMRIELFFEADQFGAMETLVGALTGAGMRSD